MKQVMACPLCDWKHEIEPPQVPTEALASVFGPGVMTAVAMSQHAQDVERALEQHFRTHATVDWLRANTALRADRDLWYQRAVAMGWPSFEQAAEFRSAHHVEVRHDD